MSQRDMHMNRNIYEQQTIKSQKHEGEMPMFKKDKQVEQQQMNQKYVDDQAKHPLTLEGMAKQILSNQQSQQAQQPPQLESLEEKKEENKPEPK